MTHTKPLLNRFAFVTLALVITTCNADSRWQENSIQVGDTMRWYQVYKPENFKVQSPAVLVLHGGTQSMRKIFEKRAGGSLAWLDIAEREKCLLIVPNGTHDTSGDTRGDKQNWNDLREDGPVTSGHGNDLKFIQQLLQKIQTEYVYDTSRLYVTGASNGGIMTYNLLLHLPNTFAAGAAFIANIPAKSSRLITPAHTTPLMIMNGTDDPLMKWEGGMIGKNRGEVASATATLNWWLKTNRVDQIKPQHSELEIKDSKNKCRITADFYHADKTTAADVLFYTMQNGGHSMPSIQHPIRIPFMEKILGPYCTQAEGAELAWDFFKTRRLSLPR